MIGEYKIDKTKLFVQLRNQQRFLLKRILPVSVFIFLISLLTKNNLLILIFGGGSILSIIGYYLTPYLYNSKNDSLNKLSIILSENYIIRKGDGLVETKISFNEIGDIKEKNNGIHILRNGVVNHFIFNSGSYDGLSDLDIIWIPNHIDKFNEITDFLFDKYYSLQFKNKDK